TAAVEVGADRLETVVGEVAVVGLVRRLAADLEGGGLVYQDGGLVETALLDGGGVDDGLEGTAWLPQRLRGAIELTRRHALLELLPDHRLDGTRGRVEADDGQLRSGRHFGTKTCLVGRQLRLHVDGGD